MKQPKLKVALSTLLLTLAGCQSIPNSPDDMKNELAQAIHETETLNTPKALTEVPNSVQQELMIKA